MFGDFIFGRGWFGRGDAPKQSEGSGVTVLVSGQAATGANGEVAVSLRAATIGGTSPKRKPARFRWHDLIPDWIRPPEPPQPEPSIVATVRAKGQTATGASGMVTVRAGASISLAARANRAQSGNSSVRCGHRIICGGSNVRARASSGRVKATKNLRDDELLAILTVLE